MVWRKPRNTPNGPLMPFPIKRNKDSLEKLMIPGLGRKHMK